mgnify:CR=1 FL=1
MVSYLVKKYSVSIDYYDEGEPKPDGKRPLTKRIIKKRKKEGRRQRRILKRTLGRTSWRRHLKGIYDRYDFGCWMIRHVCDYSSIWIRCLVPSWHKLVQTSQMAVLPYIVPIPPPRSGEGIKGMDFVRLSGCNISCPGYN